MGTVVPGNPVEPGVRRLETVAYTEAVGRIAGGVVLEAYSRDTKELVYGGVDHSFVAAARAAYAGHYPLVLSPDMIWLLIARGLARHVNENAESLRRRFVAHEGRVTLEVERDDFVLGFAGNDWEGVFAEFSERIREHIGGAAHETLVPTFSTTGFVERAAFEITLMDTMQKYFRYQGGIICGIPSFVLEGAPEDWKRLRECAARLHLTIWIGGFRRCCRFWMNSLRRARAARTRSSGRASIRSSVPLGAAIRASMATSCASFRTCRFSTTRVPYANVRRVQMRSWWR